MKRILNAYRIGLVILALPALTLAQGRDLNGQWTGALSKGDKSGTATLDLRTSGRSISGTLSDPSGQVLTIHNGRLDGNHFTFDVTANEHGHPKDLHFVGQVESNDIKLHTVMGQKSGPTIVFERSGQQR